MNTMQSNDNNEPNIWRTIVLVAVALFVGVFLWRFLTGASSDMQGFVIGIGFGAIGAFGIGLAVGRWHSHEPQDRQQEVADAYARGYSAGVHAGYRAAIAQDGVIEVVVPHQARELVPVRR